MKIKLTSVYVDDQEKALRFYTEVLGFVKKADFSQGPFRWLTVASPEDPDGTQLQLVLNNNPAAKAYQQAITQQGQPAAMFYTDDVQADYEHMKARGAQFTMPPTDVTASKIAMLNDTCGNLIQLVQLALNNNPAAKAYQQAIFQQGQPAAMFFTDDVEGDYERMKARGAEFTMPPKDVTASKIAMLNDSCGNLIQITQLMRW